MPSRVILEVASGPNAGKRLEFDRHDTLFFGRHSTCQIRLAGDGYVSRHQFVMEVSPPRAVLRDLGSANGTQINGLVYGGRKPGETPEQSARRVQPNVPLGDGDRIVVGNTTIVVHIDDATPPVAALVAEPVVEAAPSSSWSASPRFNLPDYELLDKLGEGGMGVVFKARRRRDGALVAVKLLTAQAAVDPHARSLFLREIENLAALKHPHVVDLLDYGSHEGAFYFAMDYCRGGSLHDWWTRLGGRPAWDVAVPIMLQSLAGLAFAHSEGFVHRDLKPENILLEPMGDGDWWRARVADFGLAKSFEQAGFSGMSATATGQRGGTLYYMPREQLARYRHAGPANDVWSMAATFYVFLTGQFPRDFERFGDPVRCVMECDAVPIRLRDPTLPAPLAEVVDRALLDDPMRRFQTAGEMLRALAAAVGCTSIPEFFACRPPAPPPSDAPRRVIPGARTLVGRSDVDVGLPFSAYQGDEPFLFVSYAHADAREVYPELRRLHDAGFRIWYDEGIVPATEWPEQIAEALSSAACCVVFVTPRAAASKNVRDELHFALDGNKPVLAVHLEPTQLSAGLTLRLGRLQAVLKYQLAPQHYQTKLDAALPLATRSTKS